MASPNFYFLVFSLCNSDMDMPFPLQSGKEAGFHICDQVVTVISSLTAKPIVNTLIDN